MAKCAECLPLHRLAKMFPLHGIDIPDQTMCGWVAQSAELLEPLYGRLEAVCAGVEHGNYYHHEPYGLFAGDHSRHSSFSRKRPLVARGNTAIAGHKWQRTR